MLRVARILAYRPAHVCIQTFTYCRRRDRGPWNAAAAAAYSTTPTAAELMEEATRKLPRGLRFVRAPDVPKPRQPSHIQSILSRTRRSEDGLLHTHETLDLLEECGITVPQRVFIPCSVTDDPSSLLTPLHAPFLAEAIVGRTINVENEGGIVRGILDGKQAAEVMTHFRRRFGTRGAWRDLRGTLFTERVDVSRTLGAQLCVRIVSDPAFGLSVEMGMGGKSGDVVSAVPETHCIAQNVVLPMSVDLNTLETRELLRASPVYRMAVSAATLSTTAAEIEAEAVKQLERIHAVEEVILGLLRSLQSLVLHFGLDSDEVHRLGFLSMNPVIVSGSPQTPMVLRGEGVVYHYPKERDPSTMFEGVEVAPAAEKRHVSRTKYLFQPDSVAVFGASDEFPTIPGSVALRHILQTGSVQQNQTYVVSDQEGVVQGLSTFESSTAIHKERAGKPVDLALIALAPQAAGSILALFLKYYLARAYLLLSGGFAEREKGQAMQSTLQSMVRGQPSHLRPLVCGPNSLGYRYRSGIDTRVITPAHEKQDGTNTVQPLFSSVALLSQSPSYIWGRETNWWPLLRPCISISTGNEMDLTVVDLLQYCLDESESEDIFTYGLYAEGFERGAAPDLIQLIQRARSTGRHVIVHTGGIGHAARDATRSHLAQASPQWSLVTSMVRIVGGLVASSPELFEDLVLFAVAQRERLHASLNSRVGRTHMTVAHISTTGCDRVQVADELFSAVTVARPSFTSNTDQALQAVLQTHNLFVSAHVVEGSVDLSPFASSTAIAETTRIVFNDENVDLVLVSLALPPREGGVGELVSQMVAAHNESTHNKKMLVVSLGPWARSTPEVERAFLEAGIPCLQNAGRAARVLAEITCAVGDIEQIPLYVCKA